MLKHFRKKYFNKFFGQCWIKIYLRMTIYWVELLKFDFFHKYGVIAKKKIVEEFVWLFIDLNYLTKVSKNNTGISTIFLTWFLIIYWTFEIYSENSPKNWFKFFTI